METVSRAGGACLRLYHWGR